MSPPTLPRHREPPPARVPAVSPCNVTLNYTGLVGVSLNIYINDPTDDIMIEQQHCGGNVVVLFHQRIKPGSMQTTSTLHYNKHFYTLCI